MLDFFRKYQRYFFILITIVIVISFSFFGTYNTLSESPFREQVAFTTVHGTAVTRHELDQMVLFLGTDAEDKQLYGGAWGPNFLNDGVIKKDFLETGLAEMLAADYPTELQSDLNLRLDKERRYSLYTHPQARFVGTEAVWNYFAPEMSNAYTTLRLSSDPLDPTAFKARVSLYLMQRQLPAPLLHQVLRYQEKQYSWLKPDPNLDYTDLSLFGYHTIDDWFGPRFSRLIAQFIINAAEMAQAKGYGVSKADALADLMRNSEISYRQLQRNANIGVKNSQEYFQEQLRRLGMDQNMAAKVWQQVLLFRRFFQDLGSSAFVDPFTYQKFNDYALASVEGELYQLPKALRLNSFRALQKFETYIDAAGIRSEEQKSKLQLPTSFLTATELARKQPELVEKTYLLHIAQVDKRDLESGVSLKQSWDWEVSPKGWELLKKEFPELGLQQGATQDERYAALETMDPQTRSRVDAFARKKLVDEHPEWLETALQEADSKEVDLGLPLKGGNPPFVGLKDNGELMQLLDKAPLTKAKESPRTKSALQHYTADGIHYYRISVLARSPDLQLLSFAEADQKGVLDTLLDRQLEAYYLKIRESDPTAFQKPFADVKEKVAERYFEKTVSAIKRAYAEALAPKAAPETLSAESIATVRLYPYMKELHDLLIKSPESASQWVQADLQEVSDNQLISQPTDLAEQWKLEKKSYRTTRSNADHLLDQTELFALSAGEWTRVNAPANGDLNFFHLLNKAAETDQKALNAQVARVRRMLSDDLQQNLMAHLLEQIKAQGAISLEYLNHGSGQ